MAQDWYLLQLDLTDAEREQLLRCCQASGLSLSEWIRTLPLVEPADIRLNKRTSKDENRKRVTLCISRDTVPAMRAAAERSGRALKHYLRAIALEASRKGPKAEIEPRTDKVGLGLPSVLLRALREQAEMDNVGTAALVRQWLLRGLSDWRLGEKKELLELPGEMLEPVTVHLSPSETSRCKDVAAALGIPFVTALRMLILQALAEHQADTGEPLAGVVRSLQPQAA